MKKFLIVLIVILTASGVVCNLQDRSSQSRILEQQGISVMPSSYTGQASARGRLETVTYTVMQNKRLLNKEATVYLPYDYDPDSDEKYDVIYLMHGRGGNYRTWLGTPSRPRPFKNILDNMIVHGDIRPVIVVCPGLAYEYGQDDAVMSGTASELTSCLLPVIDNRYKTYGDRAHRCMAGFSMGGSLTWHMLLEYPERFYYYLPMSMALYYDSEGYSQAKSRQSAGLILSTLRVRGYRKKDFKVYAATGSDDHKYSATLMQVLDLVNESSLSGKDTPQGNNIFRYSMDNYNDGNIVLRVWPYRWHRYTQSFPYLYDGLKHFFQEEEE